MNCLPTGVFSPSTTTVGTDGAPQDITNSSHIRRGRKVADERRDRKENLCNGTDEDDDDDANDTRPGKD
ncbi:hypothetical protein ZHAS_00006596 [Anopheles sinensis]|uniref:Uncharacterized protein n=1 Tax=Anopheles sinensis TaxID=74873 RepID=A0A084VMQ3_ANOSI|nr:hypothetical protein ZHAS_00006596 [Anopheles sinensis]